MYIHHIHIVRNLYVYASRTHLKESVCIYITYTSKGQVHAHRALDQQ